MSSFNKVIMMGNLTRDPELKQLPSGQAVCRISMASNRQFRPKNAAEAIQEVCYIDVEVWGAQAENCQKYLNKGSSVLVDGRLKLDSWQDSEGQKRSRHSIVAERVTFIRGSASEEVSEEGDYDAGSKNDFSSQSFAAESAKKAVPKPRAAAPKASSTTFEDDLPF